MVPRSNAAEPAGLLASPVRNLVVGVSFVLVVVALATLGYWLAGWPLGDAFYMVVVTVYTVGYGEVHPIDTPLLRGLTIATIVLGCTGMIFLTGALVQFITLNQLNQIFGLRRMNIQIDKLDRHVIVCGFGRLGTALAQELQAGGTSFVLLEQDEAGAAHARHLGFLCMQGDATDAAVLRDAGVMRARTLATVLPNDAANVFITLRARGLNPDIEIIARGEQPGTEAMLLQAGANKVVLPTHIGAERIAELIMYQETARFIHGSAQMRDFEQVLHSLGLELELIEAAADSKMVGQTIEAVEQQANGAVFIVQVNRPGTTAMTDPDPGTVIRAGDGVVIVGRGAKARALGGLFNT
ncbi:MAG TPA: NAD-binding protein [Acetobacteraceae bacterium]|nr:NAD-binding protein [Acetobacteraceae bacterium]